MKKLVLFLTMFVLLSCVPVYAASVDAMTDENTYISDDGSIYTYQDGKVYMLVDGKLYEVVTGDQQSIIDVMKKKPGMEKPDAGIMADTQSLISRTIGVALSVIIYVFFAMTAFTTACDLMYIGMPAMRPVLYMSAPSMQMPTSNQYGGVQQAPTQGADSDGQRGRCFISSELRSLVSSGQMGNFNSRGGMNMYGGFNSAQVSTPNRNILLTYLKRRAISIVLITVVFMLLVTSTVFTDFGLDIGNMIYQTAAKFLGF